jgi:hypothetical protein
VNEVQMGAAKCGCTVCSSSGGEYDNGNSREAGQIEGSPPMPWRVGVDIGGRFTDVTLVEEEIARIADRPERRIAEPCPETGNRSTPPALSHKNACHCMSASEKHSIMESKYGRCFATHERGGENTLLRSFRCRPSVTGTAFPPPKPARRNDIVKPRD